MRVWVVQIGEPLPIDSANERLFRCGLLSQALDDAGHEIVWWTSAFDHYKRRFRSSDHQSVRMSPRYTIEMLHGCGYSRNMSLSRMRDHALLGKAFAQMIGQVPKPDVIWCAVPIVEMGLPAVRYGEQMGIPVVLDCMDQWPDLIEERLPMGKWLMRPMRRATETMFRHATAVSGNSEGFVNWGLRYAARERTPLDQAFPFAYPLPELTEDQHQSAKSFWDDVSLDWTRPTACFIGSMNESNFALQSLAETARLLPHVNFVFAGRGEAVAPLQKMLSGLPSAHLAGWIGAPEIIELMRRSHFALAPYRPIPNFLSNIPNKIPEYLAGGLPIMLSVRGEMGELIESNRCGVIYCHERPAELAQIIQNLVANPEQRAQMAERSFALYQSTFTVKSVYPKIIQYLERLASSKTTPQGASSAH